MGPRARGDDTALLMLRAPFASLARLIDHRHSVAEAESRWRGECFVFDDRVALGHGLREREMGHGCDE
jgi:predicted sulfurtransferase